MKTSRRRVRWATLAALAIALVAAWLQNSRAPGEPPIAVSDANGREILELVVQRRSGVVVETQGLVLKVLPDDQEGSRHQRFLLDVGAGHSVLVAHNIDLAPRVADLSRGDRIALRGQFEWNEKGGVVHWTHADPDGRRPGGWLQHEDRTYR